MEKKNHIFNLAKFCCKNKQRTQFRRNGERVWSIDK